MALTLETGAGLALADAFVDVATVTAYATARGDAYVEMWENADGVEAQEAAIRRATDAVSRGWLYRGTKKTKEQRLQFPRAECEDEDGFTYDDEVPQCVKDATCELAIRIAAGTDPLPDLARGGQIRSVSAGDGVSVTFADRAPVNTVIQTVEGLLRPVVRSANPLFNIELEEPAARTSIFSEGMHDDPTNADSLNAGDYGVF
jgi:hypothetical protein